MTTKRPLLFRLLKLLMGLRENLNAGFSDFDGRFAGINLADSAYL